LSFSPILNYLVLVIFKSDLSNLEFETIFQILLFFLFFYALISQMSFFLFFYTFSNFSFLFLPLHYAKAFSTHFHFFIFLSLISNCLFTLTEFSINNPRSNSLNSTFTNYTIFNNLSTFSLDFYKVNYLLYFFLFIKNLASVQFLNYLNNAKFFDFYLFNSSEISILLFNRFYSKISILNFFFVSSSDLIFFLTVIVFLLNFIFYYKRQN
jgi:hypothetical protein